MTILLVSCSELKLSLPGPAREVYIGPLTSLSIKYADKMGWKPLILSAKYGIITPDTIIEPYNQRLKSYRGPWPEESGYYVGGIQYFKYAPPHIGRLFPPGTSYCQMKSFLNKHVYPHRYGQV